MAAINGGLLLITALLSHSTRMAANSAKAAADSLPVVERAYVYPVIVSSEGVSTYISEALVFWLGDPTKEDTPIERGVGVSFRIKNYGKTPAIVKSAYAGLGVYPIGVEVGLAIPNGILGPMETTTADLTAFTQIGITACQARSIGFYTASFCLMGTIDFDDIWGNEYSTRFKFIWSPDVERMTLSHVTTETRQKDGTS